jgi:hypothetical protein
MKLSASLVQTFLLVTALAPNARSFYPDASDISPKATQIVIVKSARSLTLMNGTKVLKTYKVALGRQPIVSQGEGWRS